MIHSSEPKLCDLHSHILYGADDGPEELSESVALLHDAIEQNLLVMVATPHYNEPCQMTASPEEIREKWHRLQEAVPALRLYLAQEILYTENTCSLLRDGKLLPYGNGPYVLIEFMPEAAGEYIHRAVRNLVSSGFFPVLAHTERYQKLSFPDIAELRNMHAKIQCNYSSLFRTGFFDSEASRCRKMLHDDQIDFFASDMHGPQRPFLGEKARHFLLKKVGREKTRQLLFDAPLSILSSA